MFAALMLLYATAQAGNPPNWRPEDPSTFRPRSPSEALGQVRQERQAQRLRAVARRAEPAPASADIEGTWQEWAPPTRAFHAMVYDSRRDRMVVLGGGSHYGGRQTLWQLPLAAPPRWTAFTATAPPPVAEHIAAAYDSINDRIVAFLAIADTPGSPLRSEVWNLSLAGPPAWSRLEVSGTPAVQFKQSVAIDESGKRLFLVSTPPGFQPIEAWQLDLASGAWTALNLAGPQSRNSFQPDVLVDDTRERLVVSAPEGLWTLTLGETPEWTRFHAHQLGDTRMLHDRAGDRAILVDSRGQVLADPMGPGVPATIEGETLDDRTGFAAAWDSRRGRATIHGGWHSLNWQTLSQTLARSVDTPGSWTDVGSFSGGARLWHAAVRDPARDRAVIYGGSWWSSELVVTRPLGDPSAAAAPLIAPPGPRPRAFYAYSLDFDGPRDRVLLYGGQTADGTGELLGELWSISMNPPAWTRLEPAGTGPGRRYYHTSFMDPVRDRLIVIGGSTSDANPQGAWELRFSPSLEWRPLAVSGVSPSLIRATFYDPPTGTVWAWGEDGAGSGPLWKLDLGASSIVATPVPMVGAPTSTDWYRLTPITYDAGRRRLVVSDEDYSARSNLSGYWSVALGASATWSWKSVAAGARPFDRFLQSMVPDPTRDRLILYGGYDDNTHYFDDWWSLDWDRVTTVLVSVSGARVEDGVAHLSWNAQGASDPLDVQRRRDAGEWTTVATVRADPAGNVIYEDATIEPGHRYGYRLIWNSPGGTVALGETSLDYPGAASFAMRGAIENPASGDLRVAFSLDRAGAARIGLYDVGGRRLIEHQVRAAGPGPRELAIAPEGGVPPGVYFVRLSDGQRASTARVVVAR